MSCVSDFSTEQPNMNSSQASSATNYTNTNDNLNNHRTSLLNHTSNATMTDENTSNNLTKNSSVNHLVEHDYCIYNDNNSRPESDLETTTAIDSSKTMSPMSGTPPTKIIDTHIPSTSEQDATKHMESSVEERQQQPVRLNQVTVQEAHANEPNSSACLSSYEDIREKEPSMAPNFAQAHSINDSMSDSSSQASTSALIIDSSSKKNDLKDYKLQTSVTEPSPSSSPLSTRRSQRQMERGARRSFRNFGADEDSSQESPTRSQPKSRARQLISVTDKSEWITGEEQIDSIISQELGETSPKRRDAENHKNKLSSFDSSPADFTSNSELDSDDDSEYDPDSDNDPDKLWCLCRQPHNNKFMICCDVCKDWFHGHCVNVTKLMGARIEKEGREWFCPECTQKIKSGIPRISIQKKPTNDTKNKKNKSKTIKISRTSAPKPSNPIKRGRGRPRKSDILAQESGKLSISLKDGVGQIKQQIVEPAPRPIKKPKSSLDPKLGVDNSKLKKKLARMDARNDSFDEYEESLRLKRLIKERKREFFAKHKLLDQEKQAKRSQLGVGKQTITSSLGESLDSLASSTSVPNFDSSTKNEPALNSKPNIVLQISTTGARNQDSSVNDGHDTTTRIVTVVRSPNKKAKHRDAIDPSVDDLFKAEPLQIPKKLVSKTQLILADTNSPPGLNSDRKFSVSSSGDSPSVSSDLVPARRRSDSGTFNHKRDKSSTPLSSTSDQLQTPNKKHKEKDSSSPVNGVCNVQDLKDSKDSRKGSTDSGKTESTRQIVRKTIRDTLNSRCKDINDLSVPSETIKSIAGQIEDQLNECFREGSSKYLNRYRSLIFNLRDSKNQGLLRKVLSSEISPQKLVRMSPEELASSELAKWRERENKHSLELIKRDARLAAQQVILKKTHKGEEVISGPTEAEEPFCLDEPPQEKQDSEIKLEAGADQSIDPETKSGSADDSSDQTASKKTSIKTLAIPNKSTEKVAPRVIKLPNPTGKKLDGTSSKSASSAIKQEPNLSDPFLLIDTTRDHKLHVFDINCKICTKTDDDAEAGSNKTVPAPAGPRESSAGSSKMEQSKDLSPTDDTPSSEQPKRIRVSIDDSRILQEAAKYSSMLPPISSSNESSPMTYGWPHGHHTDDAQSPMDIDDDIDGNIRNTVHMDDDDNDDDLYDPNSPIENTGSCNTYNLFGDMSPAWSGSIIMPEVAQFDASAYSVSGDANFMKDELGDNLQVCGRIVPSQVEEYIGKLRNSTRAEIMIVQLVPQSEKVRDGYDAFFEYLDNRNRYGVIGVNPKILKDFYILPVGKDCDAPDWLLPFNGPGLKGAPTKNDNILLAILVRSKRPPVAQPQPTVLLAATNPTTTSNELPVYKPTPLNK